MPPESPYRNEDLQARAQLLRAERDHLSRAIAVTLAKAATHRRWSFWRFCVGACVPLLAVAFAIAWRVLRR